MQFRVQAGAQVINQADNLSDGIIICGYKLSDNMIYTELNEYKPKSFEMLLVASQKPLWEDCQDNDIVCAAMPIKVNDLCIHNRDDASGTGSGEEESFAATPRQEKPAGTKNNR